MWAVQSLNAVVDDGFHASFIVNLLRGTGRYNIIFMKAFLLQLIALASLFTSCSSSKTIGFHCEEQQVEIYINDEYAGRGLVNYRLPKNMESVKVSCMQDGKEIYTRTFYVKGKKGQLFDLQIPKDYRYSSKPY